MGKEREEVARMSLTTNYPYTIGYHMSYSTTTTQSAHNQMANKIGQVTITVDIFHYWRFDISNDENRSPKIRVIGTICITYEHLCSKIVVKRSGQFLTSLHKMTGKYTWPLCKLTICKLVNKT